VVTHRLSSNEAAVYAARSPGATLRPVWAGARFGAFRRDAEAK
jgi:hypothetical protein